jgi:hypothetical protein
MTSPKLQKFKVLSFLPDYVLELLLLLVPSFPRKMTIRKKVLYIFCATDAFAINMNVHIAAAMQPRTKV